MGETIDLGYRQFSAPMADEICSQFTGDMVLSSPQQTIILFPGETYSLTELKVDARQSNGEYLKALPIVVGLPEIENGFLAYRPYDLDLEAIDPGTIQIEIMGYCNPDLREYLTLSVVNTVT